MPASINSDLGIPEHSRACLFDLDGVLTQTAVVHAAAWKEMFDGFLRQWGERTGEHLAPFDAAADYDNYVDGKPRADGTRSFLESRGIELPEGGAEDEPGKLTITGLGNLKNEIVLRRIAQDGVQPYPSSVRYLHAVIAAGLRRAVVTSSANSASVLSSAGLTGMFDTIVDGVVAAQQHLAGKPAPDTYLAAAGALGVPPDAAVVYEDALAGVAAGRAGHFGYVVGVDRVGQADALRTSGADVVVSDLSELMADR
ncbi:MAG TPA: beta-phosphoglucomutase family hydrolase [Streptosporangiaceae bacterium]